MVDVISISSTEEDVFRISTPSSDSSAASDWSQNLVFIEEILDKLNPRCGFWVHVGDCTGDAEGSLSVDSWFQQHSEYIPSKR
jgi:hypothetical protein